MFGIVTFTADPEYDADMAAVDPREVIGKCECCGAELHSAGKTWEADDAYLFEDGELICDNCLWKWCNKKYRI